MPDEPTIESLLSAAIAGAQPDAALLAPSPGASPGEILQAQLRNGELSNLADAATAAVAPVAETPVVVIAEVAPVVEPGEGTPLAKNWRLTANDIQEQQVASLIKSGVSWKDASAQVFGTGAPAVAAEVVTPIPGIPEIIVAKETRLAEIRADLDQRIAEADGVGLTLTADVRALQKEEADLVRELPVLQVDAKMAAARADRQAQQQFDAEYAPWEAEAIKDFPDAGTPGTPLFNAIAAQSESMAKSNDPLLQRADCAYLVAASVAKQIGYKAAATVSAPVTPVTAPIVAPALPRAVGAASGSAGSEAHRVTVASAEPSPFQKFQNMVSGAAGNAAVSMADALSALANGGSPAGSAALVTRVR